MNAVPSLPRPLRLFLIDDHPVVRECLAREIAGRPDLKVVGQADTAAEALERVPKARPDVITVDLLLPDRDGPDLITALRALVPKARLVVVSSLDDQYRVTEALRAGAHGYILKTAPVSEIIDALREAVAGGTPISPTLADGVLRAMHRNGRGHGLGGGLDALTARELQVLRLFASGRSTREVAQSLTISPKTVETHRIRIYDKLGVKGVVDLTRLAMRVGLVRA
jgi:DNA-binding NarL/FixJ family response regulator